MWPTPPTGAPTGLLHRAPLAFLAAAGGTMAVPMIGIHGGPALSKTVSLFSFFGDRLLVIAAISRCGCS